ncbi:DNA-3-methyladenine glycosylase I [Rathayibacter caricis DSM 15933]|uniref:DNA-3-methyladenine glycosylase I n=1 Tax=Rathayibacter caricis DSM 15933 TaxID=1328867 RepID=A0A2T4UVE9_9MICO|nr:DNA-3-methyladenine glycosylase I [Rathayibacter caricis]PTL73507.1 DNA-3-methyladenine glycosylase I [Rathayibacter caricis DSM 15933]
MTVDEGILVDEDGTARCAWAGRDPEYRRYHDEEWGVPLHGDRPLLEKICLEGFQSGLSWITILRKRPRFREVFHDFDLESVAGFGEDDVERLMADPGIIRNRPKITATIENARATLALRDRDGDGALDRLVWSFHDDRSGGRPVTLEHVPTRTASSLALSRALRSAGFRFVGPTTMYALQQSAGIVDDHLAGCFRAAD